MEKKMKELYKILNQFSNPSFRIENKIYTEILNFIDKKFKDKKLPLDSHLYYEKIAFAFMESKDTEEWGDIFYSPRFANIDPITQKYQFCFPDIKQITPDMLNYWEKRFSETENNPILQCRYAGLVWCFSKKIRNTKADISLAYSFIDSIIKMAKIGGDPFLKYKMKKALKLSVSINNQEIILSLKDSIINYEEVHSEDDKPRTWGYSFDLLIGDKDLYKKVQLTEEQESQIIKNLEKKLSKFSDKNSKEFNHHYVEQHIISRLIPYYNRSQNNKDKLKRTLLIYRDSFLYGLKTGILIMSGSVYLEKIRTILFQYGFSKEAKALEKDLRMYQKEDHKYIHQFEIPFKVPKKEIEDWIKNLDEVSLSEALKSIAISWIPDREQSKDILSKVAQKHPFSFMVSHRVMDHTGRKTSEIGPLETDSKGHIISQMQQSLCLSFYFINLGLNHLEKNKFLNADRLLEFLFESPFFLEKNHQIIKEGVIAYFNKNYIASCSILIPQIETAIREIISFAGGEIYQPLNSKNEQGFDLRPLGSLLRDDVFFKIFEKLNKNIPTYFQILLTDKRSFNLRNHICHGHFPGDFFNKKVAIYIIHLLLILSMVRYEEKQTNSKV